MERISFSSLDSNHQFVKDMFGQEFYNKSLNDTLKREEVIEANDALLKYQLGESIANLIYDRNVPEINKQMDLHLDKEKLMKAYDLKPSYGLLIVRPEAQWFEDELLMWLTTNGIDVVDSFKTHIDFWLHWYIYFRNLYGFENRCDFPTRIFNYDYRELHAFIIRFKNTVFIKEPIREYMINRKGIAGLPDSRTIRGTIGFNNFQKLVLDDGKNLVKEARIALDPIGIYRKICSGEIWCDNDNKRAIQPMFFYTGLSVHIPEKNEFSDHKKAFSLNRKSVEL